MKTKPQLLLAAVPVLFLSSRICFAAPLPPKQPTAFNYYASAAAAETDRHKVDFANGSGSQGSNDPDDRNYTEAEKEALVKENAGALKILRQGLTLPYQNPPPESLSATFPYYAQDRALARLLALTGKTQAAQGEWSDAVGSDLDAVKLGTELPHGSPFIGALVGLACQSIGRRPIWNSINHLSAAQARAASLRLQEIQKRQVSYADVLGTDKSSSQAVLQSLVQQPNWRASVRTFAQNAADAKGTAFNWTDQQEAEVQQLDGQTVLTDHAGYMDRLIQAARAPYVDGPEILTAPADIVARLLSPNTSRQRVKFADNEAQNGLLIVALALRAYRVEHGSYPAKLSALVPTCLGSIPGDPFTPSGQIRYKPSSPGYILYSVGPDGKDDGGKPILDSSQPVPEAPGSSDRKSLVKEGSTGDVVGGVNF